jgi:enoyl-CoA hydratase/carnithine racemase
MFATRKPIVAAVQGGAIGGGLGLALTADFRIVDETSRLAANFVKLGMHPGFGLTVTLPRLVGEQRAAELFLTGRRVAGEEAVKIGLADRFTDATSLRADALSFAREIAGNAPLAVQATRATLRLGLRDAVAARLEHESGEQQRLAATADFREGVRAVAERRDGNWICA